ncbi:MAG: LPS export ABC transporter periplasmic protein LptC [Alphaproteobacteria bacterium]|nr:LPS export ABC transporter periplasmic protein LptC [Alphaproteobacteria bacterium]
MREDHQKSRKHQVLEALWPRDTSRAQARSLSYSRFVFRMRRILPVVIVLVLVFVALFPWLSGDKIAVEMEAHVPNLMISKLHLTGTDQHGRPYSVTADRALQVGNTQNIIDLEQPKGEITDQKNIWMAVHAQQGRVDQNTKKLWLKGQVEVFHDAGYRAASEAMAVDLQTGEAVTDQPIVIQGSFGVLRGQGLKLLDDGQRVIVGGPAQAELALR